MDLITKNKSNHAELSTTNKKETTLNKFNDEIAKNTDLQSEEESDLEIESDSEIVNEKKATDLQKVILKFILYL